MRVYRKGRAEALRIEFIELSRHESLWGLNAFFTPLLASCGNERLWLATCFECFRIRSSDRTRPAASVWGGVSIDQRSGMVLIGTVEFDKIAEQNARF